MLEWLMVPALIGVAAMVPTTSNDKKKINTIFNTIGYGVPSKDKKTLLTPKFKKKAPIMDGNEEIGMRYFYTIPLGLPATRLAEDEKRMSYFNDGLGRPVIVEFKRESKENPKKFLQISVYNKEIPDLIPYSKVLKHSPGEDGFRSWLLPLGKTLEGMVWHNFDHIPHMTVAGTTRFGKTVFLKLLLTYLIETHGDDVEFFIIDLKGGLAFKKFESLPQVKVVAKNVNEAHALLFHLTNEDEIVEVRDKKGKVVKTLEFPLGQIQEDEKMFLANGWEDVTQTPLKRRRFIIVDEAAQLAPEKWMKDDQKAKMGFCQWALSEVARIGGGLGYRLVYATQYPTADTLPRQIKQNADGKITFRLPSGYASDVAIDEHGAEKLPSDVKGRALYKTHVLKEMQVPYVKDDEMWAILGNHMKGEEKNGSNELGEKEETTGGYTVEFSSDAVRDEGTTPKATQPRGRQKRDSGPKRPKGVPPHSEPPREERILPKRKGKGSRRDNEGGQMDAPSGTSLT